MRKYYFSSPKYSESYEPPHPDKSLQEEEISPNNIRYADNVKQPIIL